MDKQTPSGEPWMENACLDEALKTMEGAKNTEL